MRIAVLNDIHGNLPALEAVLDEIRASDVDRIVVGGDVLPGPMPHLVLEQLGAEGTPVEFIVGNGEVAVLELLAGRAPALPESYLPSVRWNAERLDSRQREMIAGWPLTLRLRLPALEEVLFCHATPRNENEIFTQDTDQARLRPVFEPANASMVVCGHTHMQFDRMVGRTRVINAGSVGMPFGQPGADWVILGTDVEFRHTSYDLSAAAERIRRCGYPAAEEFAARYILNPPSAGEMLKAYAKHELTP
jgi:predicted phosphodiesterase